MSPEWQVPEPDDIYRGFLETGKSPFEFFGAAAYVETKIKEGEVRTDINCLEHIQGFFEMANRMYVQNGPMDIKDAEIGIHMAACDSPLCKKCGQAYFEILRPSQESDAPAIKEKLKALAEEIFLGKTRSDLEGRKSMFYDAQTGSDLFETKIVDITDKITGKKNDREILLCYVPHSGGIICDIKDSGVSQSFEVTRDLKSGIPDGFSHRAKIVGIEENLFRAIILANSPKEIKKLNSDT